MRSSISTISVSATASFAPRTQCERARGQGGSVLPVRRFTAVACAILALALLGASAAVAGSRTTAPGKNAVVYFIINEKGVVVQIYRDTPNESGGHDLFPERYLVRGDFATFYLVNRGKKAH